MRRSFTITAENGVPARAATSRRAPAAETGRNRDDRPGRSPEGLSILACVERALVARHPTPGAGAIPDSAIDWLAGMAVARGDVFAGPLADARARYGLDAEATMLQLLAPVSRRLGDSWLADELDFCDVTLGVIRLQHALFRLRDEDRRRGLGGGLRRIALWTVPGDQHRFGMSMLAAIFARRGWTVLDEPLTHVDEIGDRLRRRACPIAGLSISNERLVPALLSCADAVRRAGASLMVGGALLASSPEIGALAGANAAVQDPHAAVNEAERLLVLRTGAGGIPAVKPRIAAGWLG